MKRINVIVEPAGCNDENASVIPAVISGASADWFQVISDEYKRIFSAQKNGEYEENLVIACPNEEAAKLYRVVFNFWYATCKAERLEEDD